MAESRAPGVIYGGLIFVFSLFFVEVVGQGFYKLFEGQFSWQVGGRVLNFQVRDFCRTVNDDRIVTNRANYKNEFDSIIPESFKKPEIDYRYRNQRWSIQTDKNGFRSGTNLYFKDKGNIVFLGDSVPFGWGMPGENNVPSFFFDSLRKEKGPNAPGVINAAIPSYSLFQAVRRYEIEVANKFPISVVIIQVYDPVDQFDEFGRSWNRHYNWTNQSNFRFAIKWYSRIRPWAKYSAIGSTLLDTFYTLSARHPMTALKLDDQDALQYFDSENTAVLNEFFKKNLKGKIPLILLPINPTFREEEIEGSVFYARHLFLIRRFNEVLRKFAEANKGVYFFDILKHFDEIGRQEKYLDDCCHLSPSGAKAEAQFLLKEGHRRDLW